MEKERKHSKLSLKIIGIITAIFTVVISSSLVVSLYLLNNKYHEVRESTALYMEWENTAKDVQFASDYLTDQVRSYVVTEKEKFLTAYFVESKETKRRENSLSKIEKFLGVTQIYLSLKEATNGSIRLMEAEYHAMRLVVDILGDNINKYPEEVKRNGRGDIVIYNK